MWKKLLLGLLGLIVLLVLVGFLLPGKMELSRTVRVNAPAAYSFEEVNGLENWQKWSYWNNLDTSMTVTYGEKRTGEGGSYSWDSENMGQGKLVITESVPFSSIKADLDFIENGTAKSWYTFEPTGDSTNVTMGFATDFGMNPIARWAGVIMMESEMNKAFDYNLQKIKEIAESKPKYRVSITEENVTPVSFIGMKHTMSPQDPTAVSNQMEKIYRELMTVLKKSKVEMNGHPFCIFPAYSESSMDMVCALPISPDAKLPTKYQVQQTQGGKAIKAVHSGAYENLEATHNDINEYITFKKLEITGAPWEVYVTDPGVEADTSKWITEVYYPVK